MAKYVPGVCNIGPAEITRRKSAGWVGVVISAVLVELFIVFHTAPVFRLIIFLPAALAASGFLQAYFHFCAGFGSKGVYNVTKPAGQTETVKKAEFRKKDHQKAHQILRFSVLIGLAVAGVIYLLPI